ncbi:MAG: UTP--glucose-1-phosphate uridylyltransferase GalU [Patescibacteria group bacterium]|nr:UTP--glucose-1-phosphate uridylyltransferase GalU [Patescibacteria group bacterium]
MSKITQAIIPAAGMGTRFLPATKSMPKEMLPIIDRPIIHYVVEECVKSGITEIILVTGANKRSIEDYFDNNYELEEHLKKAGKEKELKEIQDIAKMADFVYIRQKGPYGNGTPVLCAEPALNDEPFIVTWGDEFIYSNPPRIKQMIDVYEKYGKPVISAVKIEDKKLLSKYGIADVEPVSDNVYKIKSIVEKPEPDKAPSNLATHGAYLLPPRIIEILKKQKTGKGGELWLTDAIKTLMQEEEVYAVEIKNGKYYDTGNKLEYLKTCIDFGMKHPEMGKELCEYMKKACENIK